MDKNWVELDEPTLNFQQSAAFILDDGKIRGLTADEMLNGTPLFYDDLLQGRSLCAADLHKIIQCSFALAQPDAPFSIGRQVLPGVHPVLSPLISHAPTLGVSLQHLLQWQHYWLPMTELVSVESNQLIKLYLKDRFHLFGNRTQPLWHWLVSYTAMSVVTFYKWRLNDALPWTIGLPGSEPKHAMAYRQNLGVMPNWEQTVTTFALPVSILETPMPERSDNLYRIAQQQLSMLEPAKPSFPTAIREHVLKQPQQVPSLTQTALEFEISPATLKRKLKKHSTHYQQLVDECRLFTAVELMEDRNYSAADVAEYFRIEDRSNFRRSWKRWLAQ